MSCPHFDMTHSAFGSLRITFAFGPTLFFIAWLKFELGWDMHLSSSDTQKIFQNILPSALWIVAEMMSPALEWRWIAEGTRHRPERQNSYHGLNRWRICQSAKFALVSNVSLHDYHVVCSIHTSFGKYSKNWISVTSRLHDYHVVCSIHISEHSINIRKIRFSENFGHDKCRFRTYVILHWNQIRIFYYFFVKTCFHYNICHDKIHKKFFKISFLALSGL